MCQLFSLMAVLQESTFVTPVVFRPILKFPQLQIWILLYLPENHMVRYLFFFFGYVVVACVVFLGQSCLDIFNGANIVHPQPKE